MRCGSLVCVAGVRKAIVEPLAHESCFTQSAPPGRGGTPAQGAKPVETLRVDIARLDGLMNLAGQLSISKARLVQLVDKLRASTAASESGPILGRMGVELEKLATAPADKTERQRDAGDFRAFGRRLREQLQTVEREVRQFTEARGCVHDLFETIHLLDSISDGIRQSVMDMRMLPIGPLLNRFHRVVRDLTHAERQRLHLHITGENTELDKRMIDELADPMIHLIRNAADHGIEAPEVRLAAGQAASKAQSRSTRSIVAAASSSASRTTAKDSTLKRLRAKAVERKLVAAADAEAMTPQQIYQLIWLPGLSTAEKVTDVSGRGVGMDIVRSKINELNGVVDVDSEPGRGTTFTIKLPLTLAVSSELDGRNRRRRLCLAAGIGGGNRRRPPKRRRHSPRHCRRCRSAAGSSPCWPSARCSAGTARPGADADADDRTTLVVLGEGSRQVGLAVDRVLGEEDVVIKSIADNYRNFPGIAGATHSWATAALP